jgi:hypothetical protein
MSEPHILERLAYFLGALWQLVLLGLSPHAHPVDPVDATTSVCTPEFSVEHVTIELVSDFALFHVEANVKQVCSQGTTDARGYSTISLWSSGSAMKGLRVASSEKDWVTARRFAGKTADRMFSSKHSRGAGEPGRLLKQRILLLTDGEYRKSLDLERAQVWRNDSELKLMIGAVQHHGTSHRSATLAGFAKGEPLTHWLSPLRHERNRVTVRRGIVLRSQDRVTPFRRVTGPFLERS